jgi:hypothetical protein
MNVQTPEPARGAAIFAKSDVATPVLKVLGPMVIALKGGTVLAAGPLAEDLILALPEGGLIAGTDYGVGDIGAAPVIVPLTGPSFVADMIGGFHVAPGGNATARAGGDLMPAINADSLWDCNFRPACRDPRGMALVDSPRGRFWCDIYLLGRDHLINGTSKLGVTIADGDDAPQNPAGGYFDELDYATAEAVMKHHGKGLLSAEEFFAAAYGVTEKSAHNGDPETTQLDAARTSRFGLMQATGNLLVWGTDGDPDLPRPSIFGGSWFSGSLAGSRFATLGDWPESSGGVLGARGRSDHLQLA